VEARRNICGDNGNDGGEAMGQMQELARRGFRGEDGVWSVAGAEAPHGLRAGNDDKAGLNWCWDGRPRERLRSGRSSAWCGVEGCIRRYDYEFRNSEFELEQFDYQLKASCD
jgi:hypothetical protein